MIIDNAFEQVLTKELNFNKTRKYVGHGNQITRPSEVPITKRESREKLPNYSYPKGTHILIYNINVRTPHLFFSLYYFHSNICMYIH